MSYSSESLEEKIKKYSWTSQLILPCPDTNDCAFTTETKIHQHAFTARIVPPNDDPRTFVFKFRGIFINDLEPVPFDPSVDSPQNCCFNCEKDGHTYKRCREEKKVFCKNCGRRKVQVADCPRCAKGYKEWAKANLRRPVRSMPPRSTDMPRSRARSTGRDLVESSPRSLSDIPSRDKSRGRSRVRAEVEFNSRSMDAFGRDKSRGRSRGRAPRESRDFRDKSRGRPINVENFEEKNSRDFKEKNSGDFRDKSRGSSTNVENFEEKNSRDFREKSRGRPTNVENFEEKKSRDKSRGRSRVRWLDLQDTNEEKNNPPVNKEVIKKRESSESVDESTRKLMEVIESIKHLPSTTQDAVVLHFLEVQRAAMNGREEKYPDDQR